VWLQAFLTSVLDGIEWSVSFRGYFTPGTQFPLSVLIGRSLGGPLDAVVNRKTSCLIGDRTLIFRSSSPQPEHFTDRLYQRSPTGGPRTTDGPREAFGGPWRNLDIICNFYVYYTVSLYFDSSSCHRKRIADNFRLITLHQIHVNGMELL
jgi:hypothetical protein